MAMRHVRKDDEYFFRITEKDGNHGIYLYRGNPTEREEVRTNNATIVRQADPKVIWGQDGFESAVAASNALQTVAFNMGLGTDIKEDDGENERESGTDSRR